MSEFQIREACVVQAIPAAVWHALTDLDSANVMLPGVVEIERLGGPQYGVGTRWRETRRMFGATSSQVMEVTTVAPGWATTIEARSRGGGYLAEFSLSWQQDGTLLTMSLSGKRSRTAPRARLGARLVRPLGIWVMQRAMRRDLAAIAGAARAA